MRLLLAGIVTFYCADSIEGTLVTMIGDSTSSVVSTLEVDTLVEGGSYTLSPSGYVFNKKETERITTSCIGLQAALNATQ